MKKQLKGIIISNKMAKTLVVRVESVKVHSKYKRRFLAHKNYKVHNEEEGYVVGDKVVIEETRPVSKDKNWKIIQKI